MAHYTNKVEPLTINHQGVFPSVTLSFNLAPGVALSQAVDAISALALATACAGDAARRLPGHGAGLPGIAHLNAAPDRSPPSSSSTSSSACSTRASSIRSPSCPSLPSAGVGALLMLMLFGYDLSLIAFIGIILLIGIVKKNAIMMIDFALEAERHEGKSPLEAIHQACLLRFRPIMMTTMCALVAGLPLALGQGAGSELRRPLGIAIVGGLLVSQSLTLYTTPIIYLYLDRFSHWLGGRRRISHGDARCFLIASCLARTDVRERSARHYCMRAHASPPEGHRPVNVQPTIAPAMFAHVELWRSTGPARRPMKTRAI